MKNSFLILSFWLLILQANAQLLYESRYKPNPFQQNDISASAPDGQGNVLFSATTITGVGIYRHTVLRVKPNTDTLWTRVNPLKPATYAHAFVAMPGGGYLHGSATNTSIILQRSDANGSIILNKAFTTPPVAIHTALILANKDYLLGGSLTNGGFGFIRTDSLGAIKWFKNHKQASGTELPVDMQFTANGNIITAGVSDNPVGPYYHPKLLLMNQNGDSLLSRHIVVTGFNRSEVMNRNENGLIALSDGGFLFTADVDTVSSTYPNGTIMGMVVKVDAGLNIIWKHIHRTPNVESVIFTKSRELADGSVLVLGHRRYPASNTFSLYRFSPAGQLINEYPFTSNICNTLSAVTLDALNDSTFMVGGGRCNNGTNIALYVATVKVPNLPPVLPIITATRPELAMQQTSLGQSYPNPAQDQTIIPYNLPNGTKSAKVLLTDITGRQVGSYPLKVNQKQGSLPVNLSNLRNGLYLYSLVIDSKPVATKKLAVAR